MLHQLPGVNRRHGRLVSCQQQAQHMSRGRSAAWTVLEMLGGSLGPSPSGLICSSSPLQGAGTDEKTLTRIMISRSEIDLLNIRHEFLDLFDKSLHHMIEVRGHGHPSPACHLVWLSPGYEPCRDPSREQCHGAERRLGRGNQPQCWQVWL